MLLIRCPHCGPRNQDEFAYGGDATVKRPADPASASDSEWHAYIYVRDNPRGPHEELWHHAAGCRRWIRVRRDTLSHRILATGPVHGPLAEEEGR
ncbi:MAG: sarcosine oxidase subunit delta [Proteobacteria bacterium]|nr:sarcosine oxidase subunit delta [Pseudomonadota bacterium]